MNKWFSYIVIDVDKTMLHIPMTHIHIVGYRNRDRVDTQKNSRELFIKGVLENFNE